MSKGATVLRDIKQGRAGGKPDLTHLRRGFATYVVRPCEYGEDKYERANYLRPTNEGPHTEPTKADLDRLREYVRANISHALAALDEIERYQAQDPQCLDVDGMKRAAYAADTDGKPDDKVPPSNLPHLAMCGSSMLMAIEQAIACGLLPRDPGRPWDAIVAGAQMRTFDNGLTIKLDPGAWNGVVSVALPDILPEPKWIARGNWFAPGATVALSIGGSDVAATGPNNYSIPIPPDATVSFKSAAAADDLRGLADYIAARDYPDEPKYADAVCVCPAPPCSCRWSDDEHHVCRGEYNDESDEKTDPFARALATYDASAEADRVRMAAVDANIEQLRAAAREAAQIKAKWDAMSAEERRATFNATKEQP